MKKLCHMFCQAILPVAASLFLLQNNCTAQISPGSGGVFSSKSGIGFRIGINFAKISGNSDSLKYSYKPGLMVAVFFSPKNTGLIGYRSELLYSKQGFRYTGSKGISRSVSNDYLMIPQLITINITRFVQLQAGLSAGYLLLSKGSNEPSSGNDAPVNGQALMDYINRADYGAAGGIEIHPVKGLILNARYNAGFAKLYKKQDDAGQTGNSGIIPYSNIDPKNSIIQVSAGYRF